MIDINAVIQIVQRFYESLSLPGVGIGVQSILALFLILGLILALSRKQGSNPSIFKRTVLGLVLLTVLNVGLLVLLIFENNLIVMFQDLQFMYLGITLLNIIFIIWLWDFPDPEKPADITAAVISLCVVALVGLALFWLPASGFNLILESILLGIAGGLVVFGLLLVGMLILLLRRPSLWGYGLVSQFLLLIGNAVHVIVLPDTYGYPTAVYLTFALVFPLFLILPLRFSVGMERGELDFDKKEKENLLRHLEQQQAVLDRRPSYTDPKIIQAIIEIMSEEDINETCTKISVTIGRIMRADICIVLNPPEPGGNTEIICGYDSKKEAVLNEVGFDKEDLPQILSSFQTGNILNTTILADCKDISIITKKLSLGEAKPALFIPVLSSLNEPVAGILLMSPYTGREWTDGDEYYIGILAKLMVYFLFQRKEINNLNIQLDEARSLELEARDLYQESKLKHQLFLEQVANFQEEDVTQRSRFEQLIASQSECTNYQGISDLDNVEEESTEIARRWRPEFETDELERLQSELKLALQEIALLRSEIDQIDRVEN
jgi:hypothetical protein